jgi:hypothetical protein
MAIRRQLLHLLKLGNHCISRPLYSYINLMSLSFFMQLSHSAGRVLSEALVTKKEELYILKNNAKNISTNLGIPICSFPHEQ